jgi:hypothetical protein
VGSRREVEAYRARGDGLPGKGPAPLEGLVGTSDEVLELIQSYRLEGGVDAFNAPGKWSAAPST